MENKEHRKNWQEDKELRKRWRLDWLSSLHELANIELQSRWIDKRLTNPAWTYIEFMSRYFDGLGWTDDEYEEKIREGFVTRAEYDCVKFFHDALKGYKEPNGVYDPDAILNDPAWQKIVADGQENITKLEKLISDSNEKAALLETPALTAGDFTWPRHFQKNRFNGWRVYLVAALVSCVLWFVFSSLYSETLTTHH